MPAEILFASTPALLSAAPEAWYERLFGRPTAVIVNDDEVSWRLTEAAWISVVGDPSRAGRARATVSVTEQDKTVAEMDVRGINQPAPEVVVSLGRKLLKRDRDGHLITFTQRGGHGQMSGAIQFGAHGVYRAAGPTRVRVAAAREMGHRVTAICDGAGLVSHPKCWPPTNPGAAP